MIYLDRSLDQTVYGVFEDSEFYSLEYGGPHAEELKEFSRKVEEYNNWCKAAYVAMQHGTDAPPVPDFLMQKKVSRGKTQK